MQGRRFAAKFVGTLDAVQADMTKAIPSIQRFMTTSPLTIGGGEPMTHAHDLMRKHHIRHLPVVTNDALVGIVSDGDLHLMETLADVNPANVKVEDAMTANPYHVSPDAPLDEVVSEMAEKKYGCVVVMSNHKVVGVFTTVDACRAFAEMLHSRLK